MTDLKITDLKLGEQFTELNTGNSSRALHVWRVDGPQGTYVAQRPWWTNPEVNPFMDGLHDLFGVGGLKVEFIGGEAGGELADADACVLGRRVAAAHSFALDYFGPLIDTGACDWLVDEFYPPALSVLDDLTTRFPVQDWGDFRTLLSQAPIPR